MGLRDIGNGVSVQSSVAPAVLTATTTGATVDTKGFDSAMAVVDVGVLVDGVMTPTLEDSPNDSDWTAVAAANLEGAFIVADGNVSPQTGVSTITRVGYKGGERYLRLVFTETAASAGAAMAGTIVLGHPHQSPVA